MSCSDKEENEESSTVGWESEVFKNFQSVSQVR